MGAYEGLRAKKTLTREDLLNLDTKVSRVPPAPEPPDCPCVLLNVEACPLCGPGDPR